jgi:c-di-GMP-specific phosphodiesterase
MDQGEWSDLGPGRAQSSGAGPVISTGDAGPPWLRAGSAAAVATDRGLDPGEELEAALSQLALKAARAEMTTRMAEILTDAGVDSSPAWSEICGTGADLTGDTWLLALLDPDDDLLRVHAIAGPAADVERELGESLGHRAFPAGGDLIARALATGAPVLLYGEALVDAAGSFSPALTPLIERLGVTGVMVAPMSARGRILGILLVIRHLRPGPFAEEEVAFAAAIADHGAVIVDNARLLVQAQAELAERRQAEALVASQTAILEGIARGAHVHQTLTAVCGMVEAHSSQARCWVLMTGDEGTTLHPGADLDLPEASRGAVDGVAISAGAVTWAAAAYRRESIVTEDVTTDPAWSGWQDLASRLKLRACWCLPFFAGSGTLLGTLVVYWPQPHQPDAAEYRVGEAAASLAGMAIERARAEASMAHAASHDALTGLPNRALFLDRLRQAVAACRRSAAQVAVLFLDLDRFKVINDSLGHAAGDLLLVAAAERLAAAVRPGDTVARFGGDEFTVVCEDVDAGDAERVAVRLARQLSRPFQLADRHFYVSASIGIALGGAEARPEALLRDADAAMYRAKEQGRQRIEVFDERLRSATLERLEIETALRRAVDTGGLVLHYQPIVQLATGRIQGVETLIRWPRSNGKLAMPGDFIAWAEETGLIVPIGEQVLERASAQVAAWIAAGLVDSSFSATVNISPLQFSGYNLAERVATVLDRHALAPNNLCLEITETALLADIDQTQAMLAQLDALGVELAIDDFGTGYSSLARLRQLPVNALKIDQSFVAEIDTDRRSADLVKGLTSLARALDMVVIAEGVERGEQLAMLGELGCAAAQGYHLAPPQSAESLTGVLGRHPRW